MSSFLSSLFELAISFGPDLSLPSREHIRWGEVIDSAVEPDLIVQAQIRVITDRPSPGALPLASPVRTGGHRSGRKGGRRDVLRCQVDDDDKRDNREIPRWMFDPVLCSRMVLCSQPHVCWEALVDLRRLLAEACPASGGETVEDRSPPTWRGSMRERHKPRRPSQAELFEKPSDRPSWLELPPHVRGEVTHELARLLGSLAA